MPGTVEKHASLDILELYRERAFSERTLVFSSVSLRWPWLTRLCVTRWTVELEFRGGQLQSIPVQWTQCHFGGARPWFLCPHCQRRVGKLFQAASFCACRSCCNLRYASQRRGTKSRRYLQALKLRLRLGGVASLTEPFPVRPCGMHRRTYDRLRSRAEQLEQGLHQNRRFRRRKPDYSILVSK